MPLGNRHCDQRGRHLRLIALLQLVKTIRLDLCCDNAQKKARRAIELKNIGISCAFKGEVLHLRIVQRSYIGRLGVAFDGFCQRLVRLSQRRFFPWSPR